MGRAARECTEPVRLAGTVRVPCKVPGWESGLLRRYGRSDARWGRDVRISAVDPGLESAADLLAGREEGLVMGAARRQLDDADGLVTVAVAARVSGRLIEGQQAVTVPPTPRHLVTPTTSADR